MSLLSDVSARVCVACGILLKASSRRRRDYGCQGKQLIRTGESYETVLIAPSLFGSPVSDLRPTRTPFGHRTRPQRAHAFPCLVRE